MVVDAVERAPLALAEPRAAVVERAREWADREGHELVIVFDGPAPRRRPTSSVGERGRRDRRARRDHQMDPGLARSAPTGASGVRVGDGPERIVGGGSFVRTMNPATGERALVDHVQSAAVHNLECAGESASS